MATLNLYLLKSSSKDSIDKGDKKFKVTNHNYNKIEQVILYHAVFYLLYDSDVKL